MSKGFDFKPNAKGIGSLVDTPEVATLMDGRAAAVASAAAATATQVAGLSWQVRRDYQPSRDGLKRRAVITYYEQERTRGRRVRRRAAVVAFHPTPAGRRAGRVAIRAAVASVVGKVSKT